jgi:hypothetical protein
MRFEYKIKDKNSFWEKITIHSNVVTLYYRILRGREGRLLDEAIYRAMPDQYCLIIDTDLDHKGLHLLDVPANKKASPEFLYKLFSNSELAEFMLLHYHLKFTNIVTFERLTKIFQDFRDIENVAASEGKLPIGIYKFITSEDEIKIKENYRQYLRSEQYSKPITPHFSFRNAPSSLFLFPMPDENIEIDVAELTFKKLSCR